MDLQTSNGSGHTRYEQIRINASRPRYTAAEIKELRDLHRAGASLAAIGNVMRQNRPWLTANGVNGFVVRHLSRKRRKQSPPPVRKQADAQAKPAAQSATVNIRIGDAFSVYVTRAKAKQLLELAAGL